MEKTSKLIFLAELEAVIPMFIWCYVQKLFAWTFTRIAIIYFPKFFLWAFPYFYISSDVQTEKIK